MRWEVTAFLLSVLTGSQAVWAGDKDISNSQRLIQAVKNNDLISVRRLLDAGTDVSGHDLEGGATPLMYACVYSSPQGMKLLLERGADPNAKTMWDRRP
jgi:ankyrin repeat protein